MKDYHDQMLMVYFYPFQILSYQLNHVYISVSEIGSFNGSCGKYYKYIFNWFSGNGICLRKEMAKYAEVIIILIILLSIYFFKLLCSTFDKILFNFV